MIMSRKSHCTELFNQYKELLEDFVSSLEDFEGTIGSLQQCVFFKEYYENFSAIKYNFLFQSELVKVRCKATKLI